MQINIIHLLKDIDKIIDLGKKGNLEDAEILRIQIMDKYNIKYDHFNNEKMSLLENDVLTLLLNLECYIKKHAEINLEDVLLHYQHLKNTYIK